MTKTLRYEFCSDYATLSFDVEGQADWTEEEFDSAAQFDLTDYVTNPQDYYLNEAYSMEEAN